MARRLERWDLVASAAAILNGAGVWTWREHGVMDEPFIAILTEAARHVDAPQQARLMATLQIEYYYGWQGDLVEECGDASVELATARRPMTSSARC